MALPLLLSEYFAARAQSDALISAKAWDEIEINNELAMNKCIADAERTVCDARLSSGERRLPACRIRQLAECISQHKNRILHRPVRGRLPQTTGQRPMLPRPRRTRYPEFVLPACVDAGDAAVCATGK